MHGSSNVTCGDEDESEIMRIWFAQALEELKHFESTIPEADVRQATASKRSQI